MLLYPIFYDFSGISESIPYYGAGLEDFDCVRIKLLFFEGSKSSYYGKLSRNVSRMEMRCSVGRKNDEGEMERQLLCVDFSPPFAV